MCAVCPEVRQACFQNLRVHPILHDVWSAVSPVLATMPEDICSALDKTFSLMWCHKLCFPFLNSLPELAVVLIGNRKHTEKSWANRGVGRVKGIPRLRWGTQGLATTRAVTPEGHVGKWCYWVPGRAAAVQRDYSTGTVSLVDNLNPPHHLFLYDLQTKNDFYVFKWLYKYLYNVASCPENLWLFTDQDQRAARWSRGRLPRHGEGRQRMDGGRQVRESDPSTHCLPSASTISKENSSNSHKTLSRYWKDSWRPSERSQNHILIELHCIRLIAFHEMEFLRSRWAHLPSKPKENTRREEVHSGLFSTHHLPI